MTASLRSLLGRVLPAERGPRTPARAHVVTRVPPRPHRAPGLALEDEDWYVAPGSLFEPVPTGRHRRPQ